jgi:hypothetical protein
LVKRFVAGVEAKDVSVDSSNPQTIATGRDFKAISRYSPYSPDSTHVAERTRIRIVAKDIPVEAFILFGGVEETELDGVELLFDCQLVDCGLQGEEVGNSARTAHEGGRADVTANEARGGTQVGDAIAVGSGSAW